MYAVQSSASLCLSMEWGLGYGQPAYEQPGGYGAYGRGGKLNLTISTSARRARHCSLKNVSNGISRFERHYKENGPSSMPAHELMTVHLSLRCNNRQEMPRLQALAHKQYALRAWAVMPWGAAQYLQEIWPPVGGCRVLAVINSKSLTFYRYQGTDYLTVA